jgi:hypothetical protein
MPTDYAALDPFFRIVEDGLAGFVDDGHVFNLLAEDVIFEYAGLRQPLRLRDHRQGTQSDALAGLSGPRCRLRRDRMASTLTVSAGSST